MESMKIMHSGIILKNLMSVYNLFSTDGFSHTYWFNKDGIVNYIY